jgi:hypothetical protein
MNFRTMSLALWHSSNSTGSMSMRGALSVSDWYLQDGWQSFEQMACFAQKRI